MVLKLKFHKLKLELGRSLYKTFKTHIGMFEVMSQASVN